MSDQTSDVFKSGGDKSAVTPQESSATPSVTPDDVFKDQLATIKNERGEQKYDSVPKALEGLQHAQQYIPELKSELEKHKEELQKLREELAKKESVEDIVARLTASQANSSTTDAALDEQKATALFEQLVAQRDSKLAVATNQKSVQDELVSKFGSAEAANKAVVEKAKELGTTAEELGKLSGMNPKMVLELFKSVRGASSGAPPQSSVASDGFLGKKTEEAGLKPPEKSLLSGATYKEQLSYLQKIRENVYEKYGIETK